MSTPEPTTLVWYAAFGSNLDEDRFGCYLTGGRPTGARTRQPGCRDPELPRESRPAELPYRLYFAGQSMTWNGGGVAYLDHHLDQTAVTHARLYLITADQFADVVAQECGGHRLSGPISLDRLTRTGSMTAVAGLYGHLLHPGHLDEIPIVTCTSPEPMATRTQRRPSGPYRKTIGRGLQQIRPDLDEALIDAYLDARIVALKPPPRYRAVTFPGDHWSGSADELVDPSSRLCGWDDPQTWNGEAFASTDDLEALGWDWASSGDRPGDAERINRYLEHVA